MNEEQFNMNLRKFLKKVGVTSQREIEQSVRDAIESGKLNGKETLKVTVKLEMNGVDLAETIDGEIGLE